MTTKQKTVQVNFFQLSPASTDPTEIKKDTAQIIGVLDGLSKDLRKLERGDGNVSIYGDIVKRGNCVLGTLVNNQMFDVPPRFDDETHALDPLHLSENQGLGYATCFLYDKNTNILMIESVKNGVGPITFVSFLRHNYSMPLFTPSIVINPKDIVNFYNMVTINKFHVKVARVEDGTIFKTKKKSLGQIIKSADDTNTNMLEYKIQTGRKKKSLRLPKVRQWVKDFLDYKETEEVDILSVSGYDAEDHKDVIDFIKQRLKDSYKIEKHRIVGSFTILERHNNLYDIYLKHGEMLKKAYKVKV